MHTLPWAICTFFVIKFFFILCHTFLVCITLKAEITFTVGGNHEDSKRKEMSPAYKQNSASDVHRATFCSCWIRKKVGHDLNLTPWNITIGGWRSQAELYVRAIERQFLKDSRVRCREDGGSVTQSERTAAGWMKQKRCLLGLPIGTATCHTWEADD